MSEITTEQVLKAKGEELSRIAGEVLIAEPAVHRINDNGMCIYCYLGKKWARIKEGGVCKARNKIPLTWPEAMKWRDWAVKEFGGQVFMRALLKISRVSLVDDFASWIALEATPEHYIKAVCLCKLEGIR